MGSQGVPSEAISWMVRHCSSNIELSSVSNVNRRWRDITVSTMEAVLKEPNRNQPCGLSCLLLPSMAMELFQRRRVSGETFCLAWFSPEGIQSSTIPPGNTRFEEGECETCNRMNCLDSGNSNNTDECYSSSAHSGSVFQKSKKKCDRKAGFGHVSRGVTSDHRDSVDGRGNEADLEKQPTAIVWLGRRNPMDVLMPFGYCNAFVERILGLKSCAQIPNTTGNSTKTISSTIAVRGALEARPEGFEFTPVTSFNSDTQQVNTTNHTTNNKILRRKIQQLCPRVIHTRSNQKTQKCLQFLNADGSRAVRLRTPPFACGSIPQPVTMFCVAIATEDGCFLSGLTRRFELGHLYPTCDQDKMTDMTPVCISYHEKPNDNDVTERLKRLLNKQGECSHRFSIDPNEGDDDADTGCSSDDSEDDTHDSCCTSDDNEGNIPVDRTIVRGKTGPGLWHCYTAVFDGTQSRIRVDGLTEYPGLSPVTKNGVSSSSYPPTIGNAAKLDGLTIGSDHGFDMSLCFGGGDPGEGEGTMSELAVFKGRMAESDLITMEKYLMTKHGISPAAPPSSPNHPIISPYMNNDTHSTNTSTVSSWQEDEWSRQVHALITQHVPYDKFSSKGIPLRYVARHRTVAWHRRNHVTGEEINVSRIGSKTSTGSSDW